MDIPIPPIPQSLPSPDPTPSQSPPSTASPSHQMKTVTYLFMGVSECVIMHPGNTLQIWVSPAMTARTASKFRSRSRSQSKHILILTGFPQKFRTLARIFGEHLIPLVYKLQYMAFNVIYFFQVRCPQQMYQLV